MNALDKTINFFSPKWGLNRQLCRIKSGYLNTVEPLQTSRRSKKPVHGSPTTSDNEITKWDRKYMINLTRTMSRENPLMCGLIDRIASNVVPHSGIRPTPTTEDEKFNTLAEEYFLERAEKCEITDRFDFATYQKLMLISVLRDGDFGTVLTNQRRIQGVEADRIMSPNAFVSDEGVTLQQGIRINAHGRPTAYFIGNRDRNGFVQESDWRSVPARNFIFSFRPDRIDGYRGIPVFLPVLDHMRDIQDIISYEKFAIKMLAAMGLKIKPKDSIGLGGTNIPGMASASESKDKKQTITNLFPGQIFDLDRMGASDIEPIEYNRPGNNFKTLMDMLCQFVGVGIGLPLELVLLDFHRGNMASIRLALIEARKTFMTHYKIVKLFSTVYYRWVVSQGVKDGQLKVTSKINNHFWRCNWTEPVWEYMDPLKDIEADARAIAYGLASFDEIAKKRNKNWAHLAMQLSKEHQFFKDNNVPIILGAPGAKTTLEQEKESKKENNDENNTLDTDTE